jgi:DNA-binding phage protein
MNFGESTIPPHQPFGHLLPFEETGLSREQLYRSFSEAGNPTLKSTLAVMKALGIELTAKIPDAA